MAAEYAALNSSLLYIFRKEQDYFVRLNWHDDVLFPQQGVGENLKAIYKALGCLKEDDPEGALEAVYEIDNNRYAFLFEQQVYRHFTQYVFSQPKERLKWGYRRIVGYINLYATVKSLLEKKAKGITDYTAEAAFLQGAAAAQEGFTTPRTGISFSAASTGRALVDTVPQATSSAFTSKLRRKCTSCRA